MIEDRFDLTPEEEADLEAAIAEADAGILMPLEEVLRRMHEDSYELTPEQEDGLEQSIEEIERGEFVTGAELLDELRAIRERRS
jgi:predicted transcriptional regulator